MSNVINSEDIKVQVHGKFSSFFSRKNITIGVTDKFVYKEVSKGKNSGTKIYPQTRIDSYGIEVSQSIIWFLSRKLTFVVNTISKEKLEIELKTTNTYDVEEFIKFLNKSIQ